MLKRNSSLTVSPTEQMYFLNRTNGLGDPVTSSIISVATKVLNVMKGLFGGGGDPYRDIHIPAQEAAKNGFAQVLNLLATKKANGSLTVTDLQQAVASIQTIDSSFKSLTQTLSAQHPSDASRYQAGYNDIHNLEMQIISGTTPAAYGIAASSGIVESITSSLTTPGGGISTTGMVALAAGIFFLPKLLKRG